MAKCCERCCLMLISSRSDSLISSRNFNVFVSGCMCLFVWGFIKREHSHTHSHIHFGSIEWNWIASRKLRWIAPALYIYTELWTRVYAFVLVLLFGFRHNQRNRCIINWQRCDKQTQEFLCWQCSTGIFRWFLFA